MNGYKQQGAAGKMAVVVASILFLAGLAGYLWSSARKADAESQRLARENLEMRNQLERLQSRAEPAEAGGPARPAAPEPGPAVAAADPGTAQPAAPEMVLTPRGEAPAPRNDGLALARTQVLAVPGGLQARLTFKATADEPLGIVAVVVRLPRGGSGRILELNPADSNQFTDVSRRISDDGRFAVFNATAARLPETGFLLSVSEPVVADVRGTCGVGPFDLTISADGAQAKPK